MPTCTDSESEKSRLSYLAIGVTGHRDLVPGDIDHIRERISGFFAQLRSSYPCTPLRLVTGLAEGADRLVAECFLEQQRELTSSGNLLAQFWELVAALPLPQESYEDDFPETVSEFRRLLEQCHTVLVLTDAAGPKSGQSDADYRLAGYEALADYLLRSVDVVLALWDGKIIGKRAGTSAVVEAKLGGSSPAGTASRPGPVYHLQVRRQSDRSQALPADGWLWAADAWAAERFRILFSEADAANRLAGIENRNV